MSDTPAFQGHHVIEQQAQNNSALFRELIEKGYLDLNGPHNMLNLPAKQLLAARMDLSPHPGGPLGGYSKGLQGVLAELELSQDGQLALAGDDAACKRMAERVNALSDTVKAGLINGDVVCNRPLGTTRKLANESIGTFFEHIDDYALEHRTQIAALREMPATEARWAAVTQSERNVLEAIDAMQGKHAKAVAGNADAGRRSLGQAIAEAEDGSGLALSDKTRQRLADVFPESHGPDALRVRAEARAASKAAAAEPVPERASANPEAEPNARRPGSATAEGGPAAPETAPPAPKTGQIAPEAGPAAPRIGPAAVETGPMAPQPMRSSGAAQGASLVDTPPVLEGRAASAGFGRFARVAGAVDIAVMAYDLIDTGHHVVQLQSQGNRTGADSAEAHFVARNAGGFVGGFVAGAGYGLATGSWTGPGAFVSGLVGGVGGGMAAEAWADYQDRARIYTQVDHQGREWHRDPANPQASWQGPQRTDENGDQVLALAAGPLSDWLDYRAAKASYELGLANPPAPVNPYEIASKQDADGFQAGPWRRDPQDGQWSRNLIEYASYPAVVPHIEVQVATNAQATALEEQSALIVAQNAANTPATTAARYQIAYQYFGWETVGAVPEAIGHAAAQTQTLLASDGSTYVHSADGQWSDGDRTANGHVRAELDATWQSQQAGLREMAALAQDARINSNGLRTEINYAYYKAGIAHADRPVEAAATAIAAVHARNSIEPGRYSLHVEADGSIATLAGGDDAPVIVRTSAADIAQAMRAKEAPWPIVPVPTAEAPSAPAPPAEHSRTLYEYEPASTPSPDMGRDRTKQHGAAPVPNAPVADAAEPPPIPEMDAAAPSSGFSVATSPATVRTVRAPEDIEPEDAPVRLAANAPSSSAAMPVVPPLPFDRAAPGALALDDPMHPNHGMYNALAQVVAARYAAMVREPDQASRQLVAGLVADARSAGLQSIGFAQFSPDGSRVYMTDASDPFSPMARTAVGDVAKGVERPVEESQARVERSGAAERQHAASLFALDAPQPERTQSMPTYAAPRMM